jgi:hypothetical protein
MPRLSSVSYDAPSYQWLDSLHGTDSAVTIHITHADWTARVTDGRIVSGTPVAKNGAGRWVPYVSGDANAGKLSGFILEDVPVAAVAGTNTYLAPMLVHGRVVEAKVPAPFTAPTAANNVSQVMFI